MNSLLILVIFLELCTIICCAFNPGVKIGLSKSMLQEVTDETIKYFIQEIIPYGVFTVNQNIEVDHMHEWINLKNISGYILIHRYVNMIIVDCNFV